MAGLPAAGVQYAVGDDSDDPDAADAGDTAAPDMGQVRFGGHSAYRVIGGSAKGQKGGTNVLFVRVQFLVACYIGTRR
jgi:hypothetical protein